MPAALEGDYILTATRGAQERAGCIRTFTGRYVNPLALRARDIEIRDIAHHLSLICRYTGACPRHYSVAQHSVLVAHRLHGYGRTMQLAGLLHDAAEAYFNDIASPVKRDPRMAWYADLEHRSTQLVFAVYGLEPGLLNAPAIKDADNSIFQQEVATFWGGSNFTPPLSPEDAEERFLIMFEALQLEISFGY